MIVGLFEDPIPLIDVRSGEYVSQRPESSADALDLKLTEVKARPG